MNVNEFFESKYVSNPNLKGRPVTVTISAVQVETLQNGNTTEKKGVVYFSDASKGLVLNRVNCDVISAAFGPETNNWIGRQITLYPDMTQFQGRPTACIRIRIPGVAAPTTETQPPAHQPPAAQATAQQPPAAAATVDQAGSDAGGDDIPF
jgi:hypothetical protein